MTNRLYELWNTGTCTFLGRTSIFKVVCLANGNQAVKDFVIYEKIKAKSSNIRRFKVKNCKAFWMGEMSYGWYSAGKLALNMLKFVYGFERARVPNLREEFENDTDKSNKWKTK